MIRSMKRSILFVGACATVLAAAGCEKKKTGGPTGGGGSWLVGQDGLMTNILDDGTVGAGYDLESSNDLLDIACRGTDTAFVVGEGGTLLRTFDGGATWEAIDLETTSILRAVATASSDTLYVAGDGVLLTSTDSGTSWRALPGAASSSWLAVAGGHADTNALALDDAGGVWRYDSARNMLLAEATLAGANVVAMSHDGHYAAVAGSGTTVLRSDDSGSTWRSVELGQALELNSAWITEDGALVGVGDAGVIARVDADDSVTVETAAAGALRAVHIDAEGRGLAAGDSAVLSTDDGGQTWTAVEVALPGAVYGVDSVDGHGHL